MSSTPEFCDDAGWACGPVYDATGNQGLAEAVGWLSDKPLRIALIVVVAWIANAVLRRVVRRAVDHTVVSADRLGGYLPDSMRPSGGSGRTQARAATISTVSRSITTALVVLVAVTAVLSVLGASLTAILASAGVVGVALGFGAQNLVRDVLAGWFIVVEDRYGVGDIIDAGPPAVGTVERVTLRSTRLRDMNGTVWHVANGEILRVGNKSQSWSRALVDVVVSPEADVDRACRLLDEVARELHDDTDWSDRITGTPDVLGVHLIDPTGVTLRVVCDTEPAAQFEVERELRRRVLVAFERSAIPLANLARAPISGMYPPVAGDPAALDDGPGDPPPA